MAVFRALLFQPISLVVHEISKAAGFSIKSVPQEREVRVGQMCELQLSRETGCLLQHQGKDESTRVIVCAIAFHEVRHVEDRMLKNPGIIGHSKQVV
jgi:hypothetical protein